MFTLTFNRPAVRAFFPEGAKGVLIRMEGGGVAIQPTKAAPSNNWAPLQPKARGGLALVIEGTKEAKLLSLLERRSSRSRPFFLLRRQDDGWLESVHYDRDGDPPRMEPHMRLWLPKRDIQLPPSLPDRPGVSHGEAVRHAAKMVSEWHNSRRPGRPPKEVEEARRTLDELAALVREVRPVLLLEGMLDIEPIRRARDALNAVLATAGERAAEEGH